MEENILNRIETIEVVLSDTKKDVKELKSDIVQCTIGCGLESYKKEMKQRCERLSENIVNQKEKFIEDIEEVEDHINKNHLICLKKADDNKILIGKIITTLVTIGICFVGILGSIEVNKVGNKEFNLHLKGYQIDRSEQLERFNTFIATYNTNVEKRDLKIDSMLQRQLDFNGRILEQNSLLERQLEIVKTKMDSDTANRKK